MNTGKELTRGSPATLGMRFFLLSLSVLFAASLLGYVVTRMRLGDDVATVTVPRLLWASTVALITAGILLESAAKRLRRLADRPARILLRAAAVAAVLFFCLQVPALGQLIAAHPAASAQGNPLLGFVFFLVLLHALHVLGGLAAVGVLLRRSWRRPLVPDMDALALTTTAQYWHFLDLVWLVMFGVFLLS